MSTEAERRYYDHNKIVRSYSNPEIRPADDLVFESILKLNYALREQAERSASPIHNICPCCGQPVLQRKKP